jgi:hypothetical protein
LNGTQLPLGGRRPSQAQRRQGLAVGGLQPRL